MSEWQPIATAPKDETRVLLAREGVHAMHTAFWRNGVWMCGGMSQYFNGPTHWMPLPDPPVTPLRHRTPEDIQNEFEGKVGKHE